MNREITEVVAPLLSVNEPEAQVVELFVTAGARIAVGDRLCTLETTKASFEMQAESDGYVHRVLVTPGARVMPGAALFEIGAVAPAALPTGGVAPPGANPEAKPQGLRITDKALRLAKELNLALETLPLGPLVTEAMIREAAAKTPVHSRALTKSGSDIQTSFTANELLILGAGGHAKSVIDLVRQAGHYGLAGIVADPVPAIRELLGVPVLGGTDALQQLYDRGLRLIVNGVGATNRNQTRQELFARMAGGGFAFPRLIHPSAVVEPSAEIAAGAQVFALAYIGAAAQVGFGAIVNTGAIVAHDCKIGSIAHVTPGAILAGEVEVGTGALIGMGVTTAVGVKIGEWARIGNGARIHGDVPPYAMVKAGATWP